MTYYILKDNEPVAEENMNVWNKFMFNNPDNRRVGIDHINEGLYVSTVFLGIDHNLGGGDPVLFETIVFRNKEVDGYWRYSSWIEAKVGHDKVVEDLKLKEDK